MSRHALLSGLLLVSLSACIPIIVPIPIPLPAGSPAARASVPADAVRARRGSPRTGITMAYDGAEMSRDEAAADARADCGTYGLTLGTITYAPSGATAPGNASATYTCRP